MDPNTISPGFPLTAGFSSMESLNKNPQPSRMPAMVADNANVDYKMRIAEMKITGKKEEKVVLTKEIASFSYSLENLKKHLKQLTDQNEAFTSNIARIEECNAMSETTIASLTQQLNDIGISKETRMLEYKNIIKTYEDVFDSHENVYSSLPWVKDQKKLSLEVQKKKISLARLKQAQFEAAAKRRRMNDIIKKRQRLDIVEVSKLMVERAIKLQKIADLSILLRNNEENVRSLESEKKEFERNISARTHDLIQRIVSRSGVQDRSPSVHQNKVNDQIKEPLAASKSIWDRLGVKGKNYSNRISQLSIGGMSSASISLPVPPPTSQEHVERDAAARKTESSPQASPSPLSSPHPDLPHADSVENVMEREPGDPQSVTSPEIMARDPPPGLSIDPSLVHPSNVQAQSNAPRMPSKQFSLRASLSPPLCLTTESLVPSNLIGSAPNIAKTPFTSSKPSNLIISPKKQVSAVSGCVDGNTASRYLDSSMKPRERLLDLAPRKAMVKRPQNPPEEDPAITEDNGPGSKRLKSSLASPPTSQQKPTTSASLSPPKTTKRVSFSPDPETCQNEETPQIDQLDRTQEEQMVLSRDIEEPRAAVAMQQEAQQANVQGVKTAELDGSILQEEQRVQPSSNINVPPFGNVLLPTEEPISQPAVPQAANSIFGATSSSPQGTALGGFEFPIASGGQQSMANQGQLDLLGSSKQDFFSLFSTPPTNNQKPPASDNFFGVF